MKPWYYSKTMWVNILTVVAALLAYLAGPDFPVPLTDEVLKGAVAVLGVINVVLRLVTSGRLTA